MVNESRWVFRIFNLFVSLSPGILIVDHAVGQGCMALMKRSRVKGLGFSVQSLMKPISHLPLKASPCKVAEKYLGGINPWSFLRRVVNVAFSCSWGRGVILPFK